MAFRAEDNRVPVGPKNVAVYIAAVVLKFEIYEEVEISAIGAGVSVMERVVRLMSNLGVMEMGRRFEKTNDGADIVVCRLKRNTAGVVAI